MVITGVKLKNYRSYGDQAFEIEQGVNIVVGPNASGKTNLLEAIYLVGEGRSFRNKDQDLVQNGRPWARVDLLMDKKPRIVKIWREGEKNKEFSIDQTKYKRLPASRKLPIILFTPEDLRSLSGSPTQRRKLLDSIALNLFPEAAKIQNRYQRALLQRNHLLKQANPSNDEMFVWAVRLGELGGQVVDMRLAVIEAIDKSASKIYQSLSGKKHKISFFNLSKISQTRQKREI